MQLPSFSHSLPARLGFRRNFQTFPPPDALHTILAHTPARLLQQCGDAPVSEAPYWLASAMIA
jgi:hypothetical protein